MDNIDLLQHITGEHLHTFLFTSDIKLTMRDIKPNKYSDRRAKVEGWHGDSQACACHVTLGDPESGGKFVYYASQRAKEVDWYEVLRLATDAIEQHLSNRLNGEQHTDDVPWKRAKDLMKKTFPKVNKVVPGVLPVGVTILASSPKLGKTRFMLDVSIAVASGGKALGSIEVEQGDVLYLCLEDSEQLLQERFADMLQGEEMPEGLDYASQWKRLNEGGLEHVERWLASHPNAKLVVIDILQRVRPSTRGNVNAYDLGYDATSKILDLGNRYLGVAIVVVHHVNRSRDVSDPMDLISGGNGLLGGADGGMIMRAVPGQAGEATLEISHRRLKVSPPKLALKTDTLTGGWVILGEAKMVMMSNDRQGVLGAIREAGSPLSCRSIAGAIGKTQDAARMLCVRMVKAGQLICTERGLYDTPLDTRTPVQGVQGVQWESEHSRTGVNRGGCSDVTTDRHKENGYPEQGEQGEHIYTQDDLSNLTLSDENIREPFGATLITTIGNEHPDDMLNIPHDPDADKVRAPVDIDAHLRHAAEQSRAQKPAVVPIGADEPPIDDAYADAVMDPACSRCGGSQDVCMVGARAVCFACFQASA